MEECGEGGERHDAKDGGEKNVGEWSVPFLKIACDIEAGSRELLFCKACRAAGPGFSPKLDGNLDRRHAPRFLGLLPAGQPVLPSSTAAKIGDK